MKDGGRRHADEETGPASRFWHDLRFVLLFNAALVAWLVVKPGSAPVVKTVDNVAQFVGPLLILPLCFAGLRVPWPRRAVSATARVPASPPMGRRAGQRWAPVFLGLGVLSFAVGQMAWTYYDDVRHQLSPFPTLAAVAFLAVYPFTLAGILLLPTRPLRLASRMQVVLDGLMIMTALVTFSWYFVLGPTLMHARQALSDKIVSTAFPLCDILMASCLLLLWLRSGDPLVRPAMRFFSLGVCCIVTTDSIFDYQQLHGGFVAGGLTDVGWPLGCMLIGLGARAVRQTPAELVERTTSHDERLGPTPAWLSFLPYALTPAVGLLLLLTWRLPGNTTLEPGVRIGAVILVGLILLRQIVALVDNRQLYDRLQAAYKQLEARNEETEQHAAALERLNAQLREMHARAKENNSALAAANKRLETLATTDPLTDLPNHRSLIAILDQEVGRAGRYSRPCSVLFLDLDHFKALNDGCGHPAGDAALREFGTLVRQLVRGVDTVGRWGGEEFVAVLPETIKEGALAAAEHVRATVAAHTFAVGDDVRLTCSIGVATYPDDCTDRDSVIEVADRAMYAAKRLGRNQVRAADDPAILALGTQPGSTGLREEAALTGAVEALALLVEARDHYTGQHGRDSATLSMRLALALGVDAPEARIVSLASRLHDVGKVAVPDAVLQKQGPLTADEWTLMRTHPGVGADVAGRVPALRALTPLIRAHHERWDGHGYPDGLQGEAIPLGARIIAVADAYGAMTSDRPYRAAWPPARALDELARCAGAQFDPTVVAALTRILAADPALLRRAGAGVA